MAKTLKGVKYGKMTSKSKPRTYPGAAKGGKRSGPSTNIKMMPSISGKSGHGSFASLGIKKS